MREKSTEKPAHFCIHHVALNQLALELAVEAQNENQLGDEEWDKMTVALGKLHDAPIHIDDTGAINAIDLRARARRLHRGIGRQRVRDQERDREDGEQHRASPLAAQTESLAKAAQCQQ